MFGNGNLTQDGMECVSQKWCGLFSDKQALTIVNNGIHGSHCQGNTIYVTLLRSPGYAAHPIEDRKLVHEERFIPRIDQGEHFLRFEISGGNTKERINHVNAEAQIFNEGVVTFSAFPSGEGEQKGAFIVLDNIKILVSALYYSHSGNLILRLWNSVSEPCSTVVTIPTLKVSQEVELLGFAFQTYIIKENEGLYPITPLEE